MPYLSDDDIASMQQTIHDETMVFNADNGTAAIISRYTKVSDGRGGFTRTYVDDPTTWDCSIGSMGANEQKIAERLSLSSASKLTLPVACTLNEKDRVKIGTHTFEVKAFGSNAPRSYQLQITAIVVEVN